MTELKLGTIHDEKLAATILYAMKLYPLIWVPEEREGKMSLNVYADMDEETALLLEAVR